MPTVANGSYTPQMTTDTTQQRARSKAAARNYSDLFIRPHVLGEAQIVSHPDLQDRCAILDVYGDYVRDRHGFIQSFTDGEARAALGKVNDDVEIPILSRRVA